MFVGLVQCKTHSVLLEAPHCKAFQTVLSEITGKEGERSKTRGCKSTAVRAIRQETRRERQEARHAQGTQIEKGTAHRKKRGHAPRAFALSTQTAAAQHTANISG